MMAMMTLMQEGARVRHTCRKEVNFKKPRYYSNIISDVGFCIFIVMNVPKIILFINNANYNFQYFLRQCTFHVFRVKHNCQ